MRYVVLLVAVLTVAGCGGGSSKSSSSTSAAAAATLTDPLQLTATAPATFDAKFTTTKGDFVVRVHRAWAPRGADRFYNLVKNGFFDGVKFFRVVPPFVVQFGIHGDPAVAAAWQTATIRDDPVVQHNTRGTITFATAGPDSRTTQVFINLGDNSSLDSQGFAPFGAVVSGMKVVDSLYSGYGERPTGDQSAITAGGNAYLEKTYPKLDAIETATIVGR
jgi:peptidyl-prolyl cis-trans isomerase A (cyclophilin A)